MTHGLGVRVVVIDDIDGDWSATLGTVDRRWIRTVAVPAELFERDDEDWSALLACELEGRHERAS